MTIGSGISEVLLLLAVTVRLWSTPAPALMPERVIVCTPAVAGIAGGLGIGLSVGATLTWTTLMARDPEPMLLIAPPSLTVNVTRRCDVDGLLLLLAYVTERRAAWYWARVAVPVRVRTPATGS